MTDKQKQVATAIYEKLFHLEYKAWKEEHQPKAELMTRLAAHWFIEAIADVLEVHDIR